MRISLEALTGQVAALAALDGVESRALSGDEAVAWARVLGEARQSVDALLSAVTSRVTELSSGPDRTRRLARAKGFSDVGSLIADVVHAAADDVVTGTGAMYCHGYAGPLPLEMLSQIAFGVQVTPAVTGTGGLPLFLGATTRFFTPAQKLAIALRDKGCARCGAPVAHCDVHHIRFWSLEGPTDVDNGVLLCSGCHHRLHDFGWIIEIIAGEVWFIPPATVDPHRRRIPACATRSPAPTG